MENDWSKNLENLSNKLDTLSTLFKNKKIAYLDIPLHTNIGDMLIYLGTENFFTKNNINVVYRSFASNVDMKKIKDADVIALHGGGNFGDIYELHQSLRNRIVSCFPDKRIICLPQSIFFNDPKNLEQVIELYSNHNDLHLCVRDKESLLVADKICKNTYLLPDMAHSLHPLILPSEVESFESNSKILNFVRRDVEKNNCNTILNKKPFDWDDLYSREDIYLFKFLERINNLPYFRNKVVKEWEKYCNSIVFKATNYIYQYNQIKTNRLHGFILSYLLGKNIVVEDNIYGKSTRYINCWMSDNEKIKVNNDNK